MKIDARPYRMERRAEAAERTAKAIRTALVDLWRERPLDEITLALVAARAGVAVQTVIRRFGSREGLVQACIEADAAGILKERELVATGDVAGAVDTLLGHYERDGDAVLRTLSLEGSFDAARAVAEAGRDAHRKWCERVFGPYLPGPEQPSYDRRLDALVAATDLYVWKLLRRDLRRSVEETRSVLLALVEGLLERDHVDD